MIYLQDVFEGGEGDAYFRRNHSKMMVREDILQTMLLNLDRLKSVHSVCDVGCSNGWRMAGLKPYLSPDARLVGFDLSHEAITLGKKTWPELELEVGGIDRPPVKGPFDLVIVSFVFYCIDPPLLARSIQNVDRLVKPGGALALSDFVSTETKAVRYTHRTDLDLYTYKRDCVAFFKSLGFYRETFRTEYSHDDMIEHQLVSSIMANDMNRSAASMLIKLE